MRKLLTGLLFLIIGLVAIVAIAPNFIPTTVLREQVANAASDAIGRSVIIEGDVSVSVLPRLQARAENVRIANADGFSDTPLAEIESLRANLSLIALISQRVEVEEFVLMRPRITLEALENGRVNWILASADAPEVVRATSRSGGGFRREPGALPISELSLGEVRVVDGEVRYVDRREGGAEHTIEQLNISVALPSLAQPLRIDGDLTFNGEPMSLALRLDSLRTFFEGQTAPVSLTFESALASAEIDGEFVEGTEPGFSGEFYAAAPSLPRLAGLVGAELPQGEAFQSASVRGQAEGGPEAMAFTDARLQFDDIIGEGDVAFDLTGARPSLSGALSIAELDLNPYLPEPAEGASGGGEGVPPWSEEPIDLSPLRMIDAELDLNVDVLRFRDIVFENAVLAVTLENGRLEASLSRLDGFEGSGQVTLIADARNARPSFSLVGELDDVQAMTLLTQTAGFDRVSGLGSLAFDLNSSGSSQAEIMQRLSGDTEFRFADGAITGIDLGRIARAGRDLLSGGVGGLTSALSNRESTDFSQLTANFDITDGVARTNDITMLSPLLRVRGGGEVSLAGQSLDLTLRPSLVASAEGQGGVADLTGVEVPVRIYGPWAAPQNEILAADVRDSLTGIEIGENEDGTSRTVADEAARLIDENIGGDAGAALQDLLGVGGGASEDGDGAAETEAEAEDEDPVRNLLQGVLGGGGDDDGR